MPFHSQRADQPPQEASIGYMQMNPLASADFSLSKNLRFSDSFPVLLVPRKLETGKTARCRLHGQSPSCLQILFFALLTVWNPLASADFSSLQM